MNKLILIILAAASVFASALITTRLLEIYLQPTPDMPKIVTHEMPNSKNPILILSPNTVDWGQKIIIEGKNFCIKKSCPPITLKLEELTLAEKIIPKNGYFKEIVEIKKPQRIRPNYLLVAQQKNKGVLSETASELNIYPN